MTQAPETAVPERATGEPDGAPQTAAGVLLLEAAMAGDSARFKRQDAVEENWRIMQPLLDAPPPVHTDAPGTVPEAANKVVAGHGRWHGPWVTQ